MAGVQMRTISVTVLMVVSAVFLWWVVVHFDVYKARWQGPHQQTEILFTGDVFLGRQTEDRIEEFGSSFPFLYIKDVLASAAYTVINFESAVASPHVKTPHYTFRFSTNPAFLPVLKEMGVTHIGLANNHTDDYGQEGYQNTRHELAQVGTPFGDPFGFSEYTSTLVTAGEQTVALVGVYAVDRLVDEEAFATRMSELTESSDLQVVYVHWGTEYQLTHSAEQERLARMFIAAGADLVIGHHPHVVQDIAVYDGVPVVYSLGNLVFDQYFSKAVQEGLLVRWQPGMSALELVPVTTIGQPMQPRLMTNDEKQDFLHAIAARSDLSLRAAIADGTISW